MVFYFIATIAILAVAGVLGAGLLNMARGGSPQLSQKLMQWRVGLQFLAIVVIMLVLLILKR
jgi:Hypoxia induced protein conserved region